MQLPFCSRGSGRGHQIQVSSKISRDGKVQYTYQRLCRSVCVTGDRSKDYTIFYSWVKSHRNVDERVINFQSYVTEYPTF